MCYSMSATMMNTMVAKYVIVAYPQSHFLHSPLGARQVAITCPPPISSTYSVLILWLVVSPHTPPQ